MIYWLACCLKPNQLHSSWNSYTMLLTGELPSCLQVRIHDSLGVGTSLILSYTCKSLNETLPSGWNLSKAHLRRYLHLRLPVRPTPITVSPVWVPAVSSIPGQWSAYNFLQLHVITYMTQLALYISMLFGLNFRRAQTRHILGVKLTPFLFGNVGIFFWCKIRS